MYTTVNLMVFGPYITSIPCGLATEDEKIYMRQVEECSGPNEGIRIL